jgi:hypothetical protein
MGVMAFRKSSNYYTKGVASKVGTKRLRLYRDKECSITNFQEHIGNIQLMAHMNHFQGVF